MTPLLEALMLPKAEGAFDPGSLGVERFLLWRPIRDATGRCDRQVAVLVGESPIPANFSFMWGNR